MQNLTSTMGRLAVVLAGALALGSCNRAEYATLPRSASYLGTTTATSKARVAVSSPIAAAQVATAPEVTVATAPVAEAPAAELVAAPVAVAPAAPVVAAAPQAPVAEAPAVAATVATTDATTAAPKLNLVQRMALAKVTKKLNKLAATSKLNKGDNTAHTTRINGNLRTGIILLLIGLIVGLFSGLIGTIIALIGAIFIVLWLLDEL